tara:strand:- start:330 stop:1286 length:957 start_codon:yes stop_codon:yes gene_type:complete
MSWTATLTSLKKVFTLLSALFLFSCGDTSDSERGIRVALVMKSLANEFFATMAKGAEAHQQKMPDRYELIINGIKDERDLSRQVAIVDEMVALRVDAIVIAPADSKALIPALKRAKGAGIVVINIDNKLDQELLAEEEVKIPFVGPNNLTGAQRVGAVLADNLSPSDQVLMLEGTRTSFNAQQRARGFELAMNEAAIEIVDSQSANWEMREANIITASMLTRYPDVKGILAANDSMAMGALAAVKTIGKLDAIQIVGFDNISAVNQAVTAGEILATADQHADKLAAYGIDYALTLLADENAILEDRETPVDLVTAKDI